ncbi:OB-fold-like protein [Raphanus sativus]|nr:OB-fold-like protein [Raphanus sativus]
MGNSYTLLTDLTSKSSYSDHRNGTWSMLDELIIIEFLCTVKVTGIQLEEGWCYIGCSRCSEKLIREKSSFTCVSCNETNVLAELNNTGTSAFLAFDMEVAKLTHVLSSEASQIVGISVNAQVDTEHPLSLAEIVGNEYIHLPTQIKRLQTTQTTQTFTISPIFPTRELAPTPAFVEGVQVPKAALPEAVAAGLDARVVNAGKLAEQHLHLMVHIQNVQHQRKNNLLRMRMPRKKHVWNESNIEPKQPPLLLIN